VSAREALQPLAGSQISARMTSKGPARRNKKEEEPE